MEDLWYIHTSKNNELVLYVLTLSNIHGIVKEINELHCHGYSLIHSSKKKESENITPVQIYLYELEKGMKDILQLLPLVTLRLGEHGEICSGGGTAGEKACSLHCLAYGKKAHISFEVSK